MLLTIVFPDFYWMFCRIYPTRVKPGAALQIASSLIKSVSQCSDPFPPTALRHRQAQVARDSCSSYNIDYVIVIKNFLNPEGHQNPISGSKEVAILLKGWILPIGGVASGKVCSYSLCSRLVI